MRVRRALFSLTDKRGAAAFAAALAARGVEILSTGNTAKELRAGGAAVTDVADFTGFPEMLDGRVKTLHPKIHGGLLFRRDDARHAAEAAEYGIRPIDLVAVNLYPFESVTADRSVALDAAIENIDIGGPSMIRSAAKNHRDVAVLVDPADYEPVLAELLANDLALAPATLRALARKAFERTAAYDAAIAAFLGGRPEFGGAGDAEAPKLPALGPGARLRYGENPHQQAWFHRTQEPGASIGAARQLHGKELSYNNIVDCDAAFELAREFREPVAVIVKHTNPCGAAVASDSIAAFAAALAGDPVSAYGGILAFNRGVDAALATAIAEPNRFFECIVAPEFSADAVQILGSRQKWGKNVRLLAAGAAASGGSSLDVRSVRGGLLVQTRDATGPEDPFRTVSARAPTALELRDLRFAWVVAKHVKSNAIVLVKDGAIVGTGAGQMSRVDSVRIAVAKAGERARGSAAGSDAFFPFRDGVDEAARAGVTSLAEPGGSLRDEDVVRAADEHGLALVFTGVRHFRH